MKVKNLVVEEEHIRILYKALVEARSVPFIPRYLPILNTKPTMIVGFTTQDNVLSLVASLNKDLTH